MVRETNPGTVWSALFDEHRSELSEIAEILLYSNGCPEAILQTALAELEGHPHFYKNFGRICATRAVVKAAIAHNYTIIDSWILTTPSGPIDCANPGPQALEALPWAERAAYFLRDVLHYSRRDTALLLGISDANVDELNRFARKRMSIPIDSLQQAPPTPDAKTTRSVHSLHSIAFGVYEELRRS